MLQEETVGAGLRLPRTRSWYTHQDDRFLGEDRLDSIRATGELHESGG